MTATRGWIRSFAGWQARIDDIEGQIQALLVTALSTFESALRAFGVGPTSDHFEGNGWNRVGRDRQDRSDSFAFPYRWIGNEFTVRWFEENRNGMVRTDDRSRWCHQ